MDDVGEGLVASRQVGWSSSLKGTGDGGGAREGSRGSGKSRSHNRTPDFILVKSDSGVYSFLREDHSVVH